MLGGALGAPAWTQVTFSGAAPSRREAACAAMDSSDRMWIYGGRSASNDDIDEAVVRNWHPIMGGKGRLGNMAWSGKRS